MFTFNTIHDLLDVTESNLLCGIECAFARLVDFGCKTYKEAYDETCFIIGEAEENLEDIKNGEIEDKSGYLERISKAYIEIAGIYQEALKEANKK